MTPLHSHAGLCGGGGVLLTRQAKESAPKFNLTAQIVPKERAVFDPARSCWGRGGQTTAATSSPVRDPNPRLCSTVAARKDDKRGTGAQQLPSQEQPVHILYSARLI